MATLVVQLLRARDDVFYDVDSIPAGERWRGALLQAIDNASHFYLLWCIHSADSPEVESEYQRAISGNKRLVPVLLDSTPLINPLTEYQWVDFRGVADGHQAAGSPPPAPSVSTRDDLREPPPPLSPSEDLRAEPQSRPRGKRRPLAVAALLIIFVGALLVFLLGNGPSVAPSTWRGVLIALVVVAVLAALGAFIARMTRLKEPPTPSDYQASEYQPQYRVRGAAELLAEAIAQDLATHGRGN